MTNRRDMIDEALLRPGRLEVSIEIGLPKEKGTYYFLNTYLALAPGEKSVKINRLKMTIKLFLTPL